MPSFYVDYEADDWLKAQLDGIPTDYDYYEARFYIDGVYDGRKSIPAGGTSTYWYYEGLSPSTTYQLTVKLVDEFDTSYIEFEDTIYGTTDPAPTPTLSTPTLDTSATVKTTSSIEVTVNPVTGADYYYARIDGGAWVQQTTRTFTFSGLNSFTQYYIEIYVSGSGYNDSAISAYYATTFWGWWHPVASGETFQIEASEWLAFQDAINEIRLKNGLGTYSFTTSSTYVATGKDFQAFLMNQAINAINDLGFSVSTVSSGGTVYASLFNTLKDNLNSKS